MRFLLRVLLVFIVISAAITIVRGFLAPRTPARRRGSPQPERPQSAGKLVKDPVCGTYVAEENALRVKNEFFCSEECRSKFLAG